MESTPPTTGAGFLPAQPSLTLEEVYGPGVVFAVRASWRGDSYLSWPQTSIRDAGTGNGLTLAGNCPIVCSRGVLQPRARELISAAGLPWASRILSYSNRDEFEAVLRQLVDEGRTVAFTYRMLPEEVPDLSPKERLS